jgi:hypothetical protein
MLTDFSSLIDLFVATALPLFLFALLASVLDIHLKDVLDALF